MSLIKILHSTALELAETFAAEPQRIALWDRIYLSPAIMWLQSAAETELQIAEGGTQVLNQDGSARRDQVSIDIGVVRKVQLDETGAYQLALGAIASSVNSYREAIITKLNGNFLKDLGGEVLRKGSTQYSGKKDAYVVGVDCRSEFPNGSRVWHPLDHIWRTVSSTAMDGANTRIRFSATSTASWANIRMIAQLSTDLLVRPLIYRGDSASNSNSRFPDTLIKTISFIGGINVSL